MNEVPRSITSDSHPARYGGSIEDIYDRLSRRIEVTKSIRFQANKRLLRRHKFSGHVIAILSLYVIALSLIPNIFSLKENQNQILLACTIIVSTFIIILSLTEGSESFHHKAEVLHTSARDLNEIAFKLSMIRDDTPNVLDAIEKIAQEYNDSIRKCEINHENCDYVWVKARRPSLFGFDRPKAKIMIHHRIITSIVSVMYAFHAAIEEFLWMGIPLAMTLASTYLVYYIVRFL